MVQTNSQGKLVLFRQTDTKISADNQHKMQNTHACVTYHCKIQEKLQNMKEIHSICIDTTTHAHTHQNIVPAFHSLKRNRQLFIKKQRKSRGMGQNIYNTSQRRYPCQTIDYGLYNHMQQIRALRRIYLFCHTRTRVVAAKPKILAHFDNHFAPAKNI